jgi:hypothetical protein
VQRRLPRVGRVLRAHAPPPLTVEVKSRSMPIGIMGIVDQHDPLIMAKARANDVLNAAPDLESMGNGSDCKQAI